MSWRRPRASSTVRERDAGLMLLEALVALAIAVVLAAALAVFVLFHNRKLTAETRAVSAEQSVRAVLDLLSGDLREAGRRAPGVGYGAEPSPPGLCLREAQRIRFTADLDGNGTTTGPGEDVTYCQCGSGEAAALYRSYRSDGVAGFVTERVAERVAGVSFEYGPRSVSTTLTLAMSTPLGMLQQGGRMATSLRNGPEAVTCAAGPVCPPPGCP